MALLFAVLALCIAVVALSRADGARHSAETAARSGGTSIQPAPGSDTASPGTSDSPDTVGTSTAPPTDSVQPTAIYRVHYQAQRLRVPIVQTSADYDYNDYIDLDEPRVGGDERGAELSLDQTGSFSSSLPRAQVSSPNASAQDCAQAIRTAPLTRDVAASKDLNLCFQTDLDTATAQGITQKIVLLSVTAVAKDGTVNVMVTAWDVPK
jgi:hypothetical protein